MTQKNQQEMFFELSGETGRLPVEGQQRQLCEVNLFQVRKIRQEAMPKATIDGYLCSRIPIVNCVAESIRSRLICGTNNKRGAPT